MTTNLKKTKEEIIYELVLSLNQGNFDGNYLYESGKASPRITYAMKQYDALVENGIVKEEENF